MHVTSPLQDTFNTIKDCLFFLPRANIHATPHSHIAEKNAWAGHRTLILVHLALGNSALTAASDSQAASGSGEEEKGQLWAGCGMHGGGRGTHPFCDCGRQNPSAWENAGHCGTSGWNPMRGNLLAGLLLLLSSNTATFPWSTPGRLCCCPLFQKLLFVPGRGSL